MRGIRDFFTHLRPVNLLLAIASFAILVALGLRPGFSLILLFLTALIVEAIFWMIE
jgi:hypothetical protein